MSQLVDNVPKKPEDPDLNTSESSSDDDTEDHAALVKELDAEHLHTTEHTKLTTEGACESRPPSNRFGCEDMVPHSGHNVSSMCECVILWFSGDHCVPCSGLGG